MRLNVEIGNDEVRKMLIGKLEALMPDALIDETKIKIEVKSKQNFRVHEWENGEVRLTYQEDK